MIPLTLEEVAKVCGGRLRAADPGLFVRRVCTDSRSLREGDLFVGLRGESHDGDAFAREALSAGAAAVAVREESLRGLPPRAAAILVPDGVAALGALAAHVRRRSRAKVVAITGSVGKTSTKDILAALLSPLARLVATPGNYNNEIGVPLTLLELELDSEVVVCELAMRGPGQIAELARIVAPDVAVITTIAPVHLELVGTMQDVAAAKAEIIAGLGRGVLVVPAGEPLLEPHLEDFAGRIMTFGEQGQVWAVDVEQSADGTRALIDAGGRRARLHFNFCGDHYLQDALAALAAFTSLGFNLDEAKSGAGRVSFSALRGELIELADGGLLLNDAYNASPLATKSAIDHLTTVAGDRPRLAVLGDMLELGAEAERYHREVGAYVAAAGVRLLAVGELARGYLSGAPGEAWFDSVEECVAALPGAWAPGSAALVKASRALRLERVVEALVAQVGCAGGGLTGPGPSSRVADPGRGPLGDLELGADLTAADGPPAGPGTAVTDDGGEGV